MTGEQWRSVEGFDGYEVSDEGRIRSWKPWRGSSVPRVLKGSSSGEGNYSQIQLYDSNEITFVRVHHMVLQAFVGPRPEGSVVRHLDGNPRNNVLENLRYGTQAENVADARRHGKLRNQCTGWTSCIQGHPYTPENTRFSVQNGVTRRVCRICRRAYQRAWAAKTRTA